MPIEDEAESSETPTPRPAPAVPLPRIRYVEPEAKPAGEKPEPEPEPKPKRRPKTERGRDDSKPARGDGEKRVLVEETPILDTIETRRKVRIIVGSAAAVVMLVTGFIVYRLLVPGESAENLPDEARQRPPALGKAVDPAQREREAQHMLEQAQTVAKNGNVEGAVGLLEKLRDAYPGTQAAGAAQRALARPQRGLPLFVDGPAITAEPVEAPEPSQPPKPEPPKVIVAAEPVPKPSLVEGNVQIVLPANPAEPRRAVGSPLPSANVAARPLPSGFHARPGVGVHASGWPLEIVGDRDGAPMVFIPGGTFTMGRDDGPSSEAPAHQVPLAPYYMDQHEVTVRQYEQYRQELARRGQPLPPRPKLPEGATVEYPVVRVTASEARAYAKWAGKSLPTEVQWEFAARTPDGRLYPWGDSPPAWEGPSAKQKRAPRQIDPVMSFPTDLSPYGVFDLSGNAWEWTIDPFDPDGYASARPTRSRGRSRSALLAVRGGAKNWQVTWRTGENADARLPYLGFRCVLAVEPTAPRSQGPGPGGIVPNSAQPPGASGGVPF
jgi:sulfatase modifying factor 1